MGTASYGPVEMLVAEFPQASPSPSAVRALIHTIEAGAVRLIDLVVVSRSSDGTLTVDEIEDVWDDEGVDQLDLKASGIATHEDIEALVATLPAGASAAVLVIEHVWARALASAVSDAGGTVVATEWVPASVINDVIEQIGS